MPRICWVKTGDFRAVGKKIATDSVDLIVTDPPYASDKLFLYAELSRFARRVLKPGGICVALAGVMYTDQVLQALGKYLEFRWPIPIRHRGYCMRIRKMNGMQNCFKFAWVFNRPPFQPERWNLDHDFIDGAGREKSHHPWEQPVAEAEEIIEGLCAPGGLVIDPCLGSGTTGVASKKLGRRFIGIEKDPATAEAARERLANYEVPNTVEMEQSIYH